MLAFAVNSDTVSEMRCQQCHQRNATVHLTFDVGDRLTKRDLCEVCAKEFKSPVQGQEWIFGKVALLEALANSDARMVAGMINHDARDAREACQECHERPATIHFCQIVGEQEKRKKAGKGLRFPHFARFLRTSQKIPAHF